MEKLEQIVKQIERETDFEKSVELFASAAAELKKSLEKTQKSKGRILEIIRDVDNYIEKEMRTDGDDA